MHKLAVSCIRTSVRATSNLDRWRTCDSIRLTYAEYRAMASCDVLKYRWMEDASNTVMMAPDAGTKMLQLSSDEPEWKLGALPTCTLNVMRGNRSQVAIARAAGISQGFLSELESGRKRLTPSVARRLEPVLGMPANQLLLAELFTSLNRAAQKGRIDLQPLLAEAERLAEILPQGEIGDAIIDAIFRIARERKKLPH
jgi:transcriptional regulator with XRE-family HTH domain